MADVFFVCLFLSLWVFPLILVHSVQIYFFILHSPSAQNFYYYYSQNFL